MTKESSAQQGQGWVRGSVHMASLCTLQNAVEAKITEPLHIAECNGSKNNIQAFSFPAQGSSKASLIPFDLLRLKSGRANFNRCGTLVTQNHLGRADMPKSLSLLSD